jgi:hypothetical protein
LNTTLTEEERVRKGDWSVRGERKENEQDFISINPFNAERMQNGRLEDSQLKKQDEN